MRLSVLVEFKVDDNVKKLQTFLTTNGENSCIDRSHAILSMQESVEAHLLQLTKTVRIHTAHEWDRIVY